MCSWGQGCEVPHRAVSGDDASLRDRITSVGCHLLCTLSIPTQFQGGVTPGVACARQMGVTLVFAIFVYRSDQRRQIGICGGSRGRTCSKITYLPLASGSALSCESGSSDETTIVGCGAALANDLRAIVVISLWRRLGRA